MSNLREFGRVSEKLYNEQLFRLNEILRYIESPTEPVDAPDGSLWIDQGMLKIKYGSFISLYSNVYQNMPQTISHTPPTNPTPGQFWVIDDTLMYYTGIQWKPVKAALSDEQVVDTFEPFIILENLPRGANEVIIPVKDFIEENFIMNASTQQIPLQQGEYVPNKNKITVYVGGRIVPKSELTEPASNLVQLNTPLEKEEYVTVQYVNSATTTPEYVPLRFHAALAEDIFDVTVQTFEVTLTKEAVFDKDYVDIYLHGRILPKHYYVFENATTIRFVEGIQSTEHLLVHYLDNAANKLTPSGAPVPVPMTIYTQFILPDTSMDKMFMNGKFDLSYEKVNAVTIQYPSTNLEGEVLNAVHIHPKYLKQIEKSIIKINALEPFIQIDPTHKEFYALKFDANKVIDTRFLIDNGASSKDFTMHTNGITLSNYILQNYEYLLIISYSFDNNKNTGRLVKKSFVLSDKTQINIGTTNDPIVVFAQGYALAQEGNYLYNQERGILTLLFPERLDIGVIQFPKTETGTIQTVDASKVGTFTLKQTFKKPILFVYGQNFNCLTDFTIQNQVVTVANVIAGMTYIVAECTDDYNETMYLTTGSLMADVENNAYYIPTDYDFTDVAPIAFVGGLLIHENELIYDKALGRLYLTNGGDTTLSYTLLAGIKNRYIHSEYINSPSIVLPSSTNSSLLYVNGSIIQDLESVKVAALPSFAIENQIVALTEYNEFGYVVKMWCIYKKGKWVTCEDTFLEDKFINYTLSNKTLELLNCSLYNGQTCNGFFYQYDISVEYPLEYGALKTSDKLEYEIYSEHYYLANQNSLSVYIDGYRQYPATAKYDGIIENPPYRFKIPKTFLNLPLEYILERTESYETTSCDFVRFVSSDGDNQIFKSIHRITGKNLTLFIDGLRQSKQLIEVLDDFHFRVINYYTDKRITNHLLLEIRNDVSLKEATFKVGFDKQFIFDCNDITLPKDLLQAHDKLLIYWNGKFLGDRYKIDFTKESLVILDSTFKEKSIKDDTVIVSWR